jgi:integrase
MRGHIRKRGKKYAVVFYLGLDENGKKKYKWFSGFDTKKAASEYLLEKGTEITKGMYVDPKGATVESFFTEWLEYKRTRVRIGTYVNYEKTIQKHIIPHLGRHKMDKLSAPHLQRMYTKLLNPDEGNLRATSVKEVHTLISTVLKQAVKWGVVQRNVAQLVDPPRRDTKSMQTWSVDQVQTFLDAAQDSKYYVVYLMAITTGMRKGEILGLHWDDVDIPGRRLQVVRTLGYYKSTLTIGPPKTDSGRRTVTFPDLLADALTKHRKQQVEARMKMGAQYNDAGYVFARPDGSPVKIDGLRGDWRRLMREIDVPTITFHSLRHTHATLLFQQDVHPKVVQERLGHSSVRITLDIYSHVIPSMQDKVAEDFGALLTPKKKAD